ncbi:type II secretion system protein [Clostridioides difficile]
MKLRKNKKGFTLVELLVVIAIIGILAVVAVPALFSNINKAKVASVESDYSSIKSAALSYYSDKNKVPANLNELETYMETVPTKADVGGTYDIISKDKKLALKIGTTSDKPSLTKAQVEKLINDIGKEKIYLDADLKTKIEDTNVINDVFYIALIDNTDL